MKQTSTFLVWQRPAPGMHIVDQILVFIDFQYLLNRLTSDLHLLNVDRH